MKLRARLALLYTSIVGGILLLFGAGVYVAVSFTLTNQVDVSLKQTAEAIIDGSRVGSVGELTILSLPKLDLAADILIQVWDRDRNLLRDTPNIRDFGEALDPFNLNAGQPVFRDLDVGGARLRVLTVPMVIANSERIIGVMQVGRSLAVVDNAQRVLQVGLVLGVFISMAIAALAGWFSTVQALSPLETVTQTALQITRADDLSRRIPYNGPPEDEVGQLITAFNQTLERLENLFDSQRRFVADVGHELRTPLTVIKGNAALLRRMETVDLESLDSIDNEVDRLSRLVGDLLLLAQAEAGKLPLVHEVVELDSLLFDALARLKVLAEGRVTMRLSEIDQVLVCGDADRLKQVLLNLIGNAIKYTPVGGQVVAGL